MELKNLKVAEMSQNEKINTNGGRGFDSGARTIYRVAYSTVTYVSDCSKYISNGIKYIFS